MPDTSKQFGLRIITEQDRSLPASIIRGALACIEPFYSTAMSIRNSAYDRGIFKIHDLGRPTISIGNITTGGTGKTPVVKWVADELRHRGYHPAILLRGYGSKSTGISDEAQLLDQSLNADLKIKVPVQANPSRIAGAVAVLRDHPAVTHFILDDGFQHRRARRDFNLVLISATQPFGFDRVLPRGLLREPLAGLGRADAFLITRCSLVSPESVMEVNHHLTQHHPRIPIFHSDHVPSSMFMPSTGQTVLAESLAGQKVFLTAGIGDPAAFEKQITTLGCIVTGTRWFPDHHAFSASDVSLIFDAAKQSGAGFLLTTEKDWVKIRLQTTVDRTDISIAVAKLEIRFRDGDAERLIELAVYETINE